MVTILMDSCRRDDLSPGLGRRPPQLRGPGAELAHAADRGLAHPRHLHRDAGPRARRRPHGGQTPARPPAQLPGCIYIEAKIM